MREHVAADSLNEIKGRVSAFVRRIDQTSAASETMRKALHFESVPAGRMGMTRAQALDLILQLAQGAEVNRSYAQILRGGADVFGTTPVDEVSVEAILASAGVSRRTFYQFFRNKLEVLAAIADLGFHLLTERVVDAMPGHETPRMRLTAMVRVYIGVYALAGDLLQVLVAEAQRPRSPLAPSLEEHVASVLREYAPAYRALSGDEEADDMELRARVSAVLGLGLALGLSPTSPAHRMQSAMRVGESFAGLD